MTIRATLGARLLVAAALAWVGLALCAQAAHATYGKVSVAKLNDGGNPTDQFKFSPKLTPSQSDFSLTDGESSPTFSVECNVDRLGHPGECSKWGYPTLSFTEQPTSGYTLTDITCRYTQGEKGYAGDVTASSPVKPDSEVANDPAKGSVSLKVHWYEKVKCWFTNTKTPPPTGTIKVTKSLVPASDPGKFNLLVDGQTQAADVGDGGTTGAVAVATGAHTVGEAAGTGTDLANYTSSLACVDTAHGNTADNDGSLDVGDGDAWECVIANTRKTTPPPTTPPTEQPPAPTQAPSTPAPAPQIKVKPARVRPGSAKATGPTGCVRTTGRVAATVTGRRIVKVTFSIDGKVVKTLTRPNAKGGQWKLPIALSRLEVGTHRMTVKVQFARSSQTAAKTMRFSFSRCRSAVVRPQFTG